jgi:hypothetical protein
MTPKHTPISDAALVVHWPAFTEETFHFLLDQAIPHYPELKRRVRERLEHGKDEYGDASFALAEDRLLDEIGQEYMDVIGWAFLAWCSTDDSIYKTIAAHAAHGYAKLADVIAYKAQAKT